MDANGLRFWMLSDENHWNLLGDPPGLAYEPARRALRLASQRRQVSFPGAEETARERLERVPQTLDVHGNRADWDAESRTVAASGRLGGEFEIYRFDDEAASVTDVVMGHDGVLYVAVSGRVLMHDRRERWDDRLLTTSGFAAWRLAAEPRGGVWALDRAGRKLARVHGMPLPRRPFAPFDPDVTRPCQENPDSPRISVLPGVQWPAGEDPVALACSASGRLACLGWDGSGGAQLRFLEGASALSAPLRLLGIAFPYSLSWVSETRVAVLLVGAQEAPVYEVETDAGRQWPVGDLYPLKPEYDGGPFVHGLAYPPPYPTIAASRALHRLSFPFFATGGQATNRFAYAPLDSGSPQTVWHRLYLEAVIPEGCGIRVWLASAQEFTPHESIEAQELYEHRFGQIFDDRARSDIPVGAWLATPSELPHHPGLLPCAAKPGSAGLFTVLIQRSARRVRDLTGRFLLVRVELIGDGHKTPELFGLRAYASRFSYIQRYLPELYREFVFAPEANEPGAATPHDFLQRFVANVEGTLTTLEDRVAHSYLLTEPATTPDEAIEWLASWVGMAFDDAVPNPRRRALLAAAPELQRWHGTLRGLKLSLELATGGAVSGGELVVVEDFKLRRTFATILGADLADDQDPLTAGGTMSGNSYVGDTLFLGEENRKEFLALFAPDLLVDTSQQAAIDALYAKLAYRVTVLVHEEIEAQDLGLVRRIAEREAPAHVAVRVLAARAPFLVGMASLVGVDSYLAGRREREAARVGHSRLGRGDFVQGPAALDPRIQGTGSGVSHAPATRPLAFAPDVTTTFGRSLTLDGSGSRAFGGRRVVSYIWQYISGG